MQVDLPILFDRDCTKSYPSITPSLQVCSGRNGGGKDTCQGDSGGPFVYYSNNRWNLVGITSFGNGCGMFKNIK